jgi:restriction system protein
MINGYSRGVYVTIKGYTKDAQHAALLSNIDLWDVQRLATHLEEYRWKWSDELKSLLESRAPSCPECGERMILRRAKKGFYEGQLFWGCNPHRCRTIVAFNAK